MEQKTAETMPSTISVRLTNEERNVLARLASRDERTVSNYVRKHLRTNLDQERGAHQ